MLGFSVIKEFLAFLRDQVLMFGIRGFNATSRGNVSRGLGSVVGGLGLLLIAGVGERRYGILGIIW